MPKMESIKTGEKILENFSVLVEVWAVYSNCKLPAVFLDSIRATVFCLIMHFVFNCICLRLYFVLSCTLSLIVFLRLYILSDDLKSFSPFLCSLLILKPCGCFSPYNFQSFSPFPCLIVAFPWSFVYKVHM